MIQKRTDLAEEACALYEERGGVSAEGVETEEISCGACTVTNVRIVDARGSEALGKPQGSYVTLRLPPMPVGGDTFAEIVRCGAKQLRALLAPAGEAPVLVAGLGNRAITSDAIGPMAVEHLLITRHLRRALPQRFRAFAPLCAIAPDVLGNTGMESAEVIRGVAERVEPSCVIVIDALMARQMQRLCSTVQFSDTGLIPGSGIGNHRMALNEQTLGVPVLSVGVPTVIDAATVALDLLEDAGIAPPPEEQTAHLRESGAVVTVKDIDMRVKQLSKLIGYIITSAVQPALDVEDIAAFLE